MLLLTVTIQDPGSKLPIIYTVQSLRALPSEFDQMTRRQRDH